VVGSSDTLFCAADVIEMCLNDPRRHAHRLGGPSAGESAPDVVNDPRFNASLLGNGRVEPVFGVEPVAETATATAEYKVPAGPMLAPGYDGLCLLVQRHPMRPVILDALGRQLDYRKGMVADWRKLAPAQIGDFCFPLAGQQEQPHYVAEVVAGRR